MINNTINKKKHGSSIIPSISIDGIKEYTPSTIANEFANSTHQWGKTLHLKYQRVHMELTTTFQRSKGLQTAWSCINVAKRKFRK